MKLEEVEEKLGEIYGIASSAQDYVRAVMRGEVSGVKLTDKQKKRLKEMVVISVDKIIGRATKVKESLQ